MVRKNRPSFGRILVCWGRCFAKKTARFAKHRSAFGRVLVCLEPRQPRQQSVPTYHLSLKPSSLNWLGCLSCLSCLCCRGWLAWLAWPSWLAWLAWPSWLGCLGCLGWLCPWLSRLGWLGWLGPGLGWLGERERKGGRIGREKSRNAEKSIGFCLDLGSFYNRARAARAQKLLLTKWKRKMSKFLCFLLIPGKSAPRAPKKQTGTDKNWISGSRIPHLRFLDFQASPAPDRRQSLIRKPRGQPLGEISEGGLRSLLAFAHLGLHLRTSHA